MNKILLITTGGTLACAHTPEGLAPTLKGRDIIEYSEYRDEDIDIMDLRLIDSSVMTDDDRAELAEIIYGNRDDYDAFIVTHGTDSMAYTAAYLDCALKNFDKTVVITGAQYPLMDEGNDAVANLNLAVETALNGYYGICVAFYGKLIPAKSVTKVDTESFDGFISVTNTYITAPVALPQGERELLLPTERTGLIYITPNLDASTILGYGAHDAVVALVLGAGGMPKHQERAFDELKAESNVKVYIKSQCMYGKVEAIYEAHSGASKYTRINDSSVEWAVYAAMFNRI